MSARAIVIHAPGDLRVESVETPQPADGEVTVRIRYGGICGSDLHYWTHGAAGESILKAPMILGHEVSGVIEDPGTTSLSVGTPVTIFPGTPGTLPGRFPADRPQLAPGTTYLGSAARFPHTEGGFRDTFTVPERMIRLVPYSVDLQTAALAEPAAVAWHAVNRAGDVKGKRVLVIGSGPIGSLIVAVARRAGAAEIIATDLFDRPREIAEGVGATQTLDARDSEAIAAVDADVVFESSGSPAGWASAVKGASRAATVVMVGLLPPGDQPLPMSIAITKELDLRGSFRFSGEMDDVLAAMADGSLQLEGIVTHVFSVDDTAEAFATAKDASASGKVLIAFAREGDPHEVP